MNVFLNSPGKGFFARKFFGFNSFVNIRTLRSAVVEAMLGCVFVFCAGLVAQETAGPAAFEDGSDAQATHKSLPNAPSAQSQADDQPAPQT